MQLMINMVIMDQIMEMLMETSTRTTIMEGKEMEAMVTAPMLGTPILMPDTIPHIQKMAIQEELGLQEEATTMTVATMAAVAIRETMEMGINQMKKIGRMRMGRIGGQAEMVRIAINKTMQ